jgi:hypothetical protein
MVVDYMKSNQNLAACQLRIRDGGDQSEGYSQADRSDREWCGWPWLAENNDRRMFGGFEMNETTGRTQ